MSVIFVLVVSLCSAVLTALILIYVQYFPLTGRRLKKMHPSSQK